MKQFYNSFLLLFFTGMQRKENNRLRTEKIKTEVKESKMMKKKKRIQRGKKYKVKKEEEKANHKEIMK